MDRSKQHHFQTRTSMIYYVAVCFRYSNPEVKSKHTDYQSLPGFVIFSLKKNHHHAQIDFDFGQVHIVLWLSYCQDAEKISVEPCLSWQLNCWSLRCSWSIPCRRCSNYIFILDLTHDFNRLGKDNCKTGRKSLKFWYLVCLIIEILRYISGNMDLVYNVLILCIFNIYHMPSVGTFVFERDIW